MQADSVGQMNEGRTPVWKRHPDAGVAILLFMLALVPRLLDLSVFLTTDEPAWIMRSARFVQALRDGRFEETFQTNHPGVTTMWTGSFGLSVYYHLLYPGRGDEPFGDFLSHAGDPYLTADMLPAVRFPTAVLAAACTAFAYLLAKRTFSRAAALLGTIFIALDPFFIAHSRVLHHDALATMFVMVAVLSLVSYWFSEDRALYAVAAGIATGLAWLSKASTLFLGPWVALLFVVICLVRSVRSRRPCVGSTAVGLAAWGVAAAVTFVALWPAMWTGARQAVELLFTASTELAESGHLQFFRGQVTTDAGPLFYPVVLLFRTTPLTLVGLLLAVVCLLAGVLQRGRRSPTGKRALSARQEEQWNALAVLLFFVVTFMMFISLSAKKQDRYLLPVFPIIALCASLGYMGTLRAIGWSLGFRSGAGPGIGLYGFAGLCLAGKLVLVCIYHPYYLSFYNPLVGGATEAQRQLLVGWGEGMNLVGRYLNQKKAEDLTVAAVPFRTLVPYFEGTVTNYLTSNAPALSADYVVTYINQVQRMGPDRALWEYYEKQEPEAVFKLHGIEYARLYPGPKLLTPRIPDEVERRVEGSFGDRIELVGYRVGPGDEGMAVELFWRAKEPMTENYRFSVRLVDEWGHRWSQQEGQLLDGLLPTSHLPPGYVVRDRRALELPPGMPRGEYLLEIYVYSPTTGVDLPVIGRDGRPASTFGFRAGPIAVPGRPVGPDSVSPQRLFRADLVEGIRLLGCDMAADSVAPGQRVSPLVYWEATQSIRGDYRVRLWLEGAGGGTFGTSEHAPAGGQYPTGAWKAGDVVTGWYDLTVPADIPNGKYSLMLALVDARLGDILGESIALVDLTVEGRIRRFDVPEDIHRPQHADFEGQIELLGYSLELDDGREALLLKLATYWRALSPMSDSYKIFVHVVDSHGRIVAQKDAVPGDGTAPTNGWLAGEVFVENTAIALASPPSAADFTLRIGWYEAESGRRLNVYGVERREDEDFVELDSAFTLAGSEIE